MLNFIQGEQVAINDRVMTVTKRTADGRWLFEDHDNGATQFLTEASIAKMLSADSFKQLKAANDSKERAAMNRKSFDSYSEPLKKEARRRRHFVRFKFEHGPNLPFTDKKLKSLIEDAAAAINDPNPPSAKTLHIWQRLLKKSGGDIRGLISRTKSQGNRGPRLHEEVLSIINDIIDTHYMTTLEPSMKDTYDMVFGAITDWNDSHPDDQLKYPSEYTVRRMIKLRPEYDLWKARRGEQEANNLFKFTYGYAPADRPLQLVQLDHTRANVMVIDQATGLVMDRPWVTAAIDIATRMIVGIHIDKEAPSAETVMACIYNMVRLKDEAIALIGKPGYVWPAFGVPEKVVVDHAVEMHGVHTQDSAQQIGFEFQIAPRGNPQYRGSGERWFRTLSEQLFNVMPGTTRSGIEDKGERDPVKTACIPFQDMQRLVYMYVCEYNQSFHSALQGVPLEVWNQKVKTYPVTLPPSDSELAVLLMTPESRTLQHYGLSFECLRYNAPRLNQLFRQQRHQEIQFRVNRSDLGKIWFLDPETGRYEPAFAIASSYATGLSLWQHQAIRALANKQKNDVVRLADLIRIKRERWEAVAEAASRGSKRRKEVEKAKAKADQKAERDKPVEVDILDQDIPEDQLASTDTAAADAIAARIANKGMTARINPKKGA